jgi:hypothetical protein
MRLVGESCPLQLRHTRARVKLNGPRPAGGLRQGVQSRGEILTCLRWRAWQELSSVRAASSCDALERNVRVRTNGGEPYCQ